ncbi:unnamed protein product [Nezara viridula]|uniref:Uncharacterized protein n=1 Tax=Nezara viridula TaxID=85310 RepID=A0A9P0HDS4_NEZVI|nr:unnamed protein product [Nezara viridula]
MCKLEASQLKDVAKPVAEPQHIPVHQVLTEAERFRLHQELRKRRKAMLLENSILRRLGPNAKLNLNLHWGYLERVMVKKEDLPPLNQ